MSHREIREERSGEGGIEEGKRIEDTKNHYKSDNYCLIFN